MAGLALYAALAGTAISAYGAYESGQARSDASQYQAAVARNNQIVANQNANYATQTGNVLAYNKQLQTSQLIGRARTQAGGLGLDPNSGSPLRLQEDTAALGATDTNTIRNNAARAAYNYQVQGSDFGAAAQLAQMQAGNEAAGGNLAAFSSIIGGASSVADKWARPTSNSNVTQFAY